MSRAAPLFCFTMHVHVPEQTSTLSNARQNTHWRFAYYCTLPYSSTRCNLLRCTPGTGCFAGIGFDSSGTPTHLARPRKLANVQSVRRDMQGLRTLQHRSGLCRPLRHRLPPVRHQQLRCLASGGRQDKSWGDLLSTAADLGRYSLNSRRRHRRSFACPISAWCAMFADRL